MTSFLFAQYLFTEQCFEPKLEMHFVFKAILGALSVIIGFWAGQSNGKWEGLESQELKREEYLLPYGFVLQASHSVPMGL